MSAGDVLHRLLAGFASALKPLEDAAASPDALARFVGGFGWSLAPSDSSHVSGSLSGISVPSDPSALTTEELVSQIAAVAEAIRSISSSGAPAAFASTFPGDVLAYLIHSALAANGPKLFALLHFFGVLTERHVPAESATGRGEYIAREVHWDRLAALGSRPADALRQAYGWGGEFRGDDLLRSIGILIQAFGGHAGMFSAGRDLIDEYWAPGSAPPSGLSNLIVSLPQLSEDVFGDGTSISTSIALLGIPIPPIATAPAPADGLALMPVITGQAGDTIRITDQVTMTISGDVLSRPVRAELHPGSSALRATPGDTHITGTARVDAHASPATPWLAFGDASSTRLEVTAAHASVSLDGTLDGELEMVAEAGVDTAVLVIDLGGSDSFVGGILGGQPIRTPLALVLHWSSRSGLSFAGQSRLAVSVPVARTIGPITVTAIGLGLGSEAGAATFDATVTASGTLGPFTVTVAEAGLRVRVEPVPNGHPAGNLGSADAGIGFKPPAGIGMKIDTSVVTGGGFVYHDPVMQLYAGALQLSLHERMTLTAFGLVATKMPDGSRGYSLIVFITAEGFQPIQLGMGFTLNGIGGMVAVHRTFDEDVLRAGLKNDTLGTLLFPRDPVGNAPALIAALAAAFPARQGSYLLGLLVRIGWFTPPLVLLDLALILELGARTRLLVLGRISALLPSPDNDLVRLILDSMGVIDFDQGTVSIDAILVDSRLAHKFALTGAMALRARWSSGPGSAFVLAVGGLNPHFAPPEALPVLQRVAIALSSGDNPRLTCEAYFAITSNTVQFGAHAHLYAAAYGFSVEGDIGYDVLIQIAPLHFVADFNAKVQLKHGSSSLFMVSVDGELEGPRPLRVSGKASFSIFWCDFTVRFDRTLVDGEAPPAPPAIDVLAQLKLALATPQSWTAQRAPGHSQGVALRALPPDSNQLVLDPLGRLLVKQQVVPLNTGRDIETFGGAPVSGARRFQLAATLNGTSQHTDAVQDQFAPANFFDLSDDEKLAAPSFETMDAGLIFGDADVSFDPGQLIAAPLQYEQIVIDDLAAPPDASPPRPTYTLRADQLLAMSRSGAAARAPIRTAGLARFRAAEAEAGALLRPPAWRIVPIADGAPAAVSPTVRTWSEHLVALDALNRGMAAWQIVPAHELTD